MARDLKVGDSIRTLNGTVKVNAIGEGKVIPVYNLDVAEDADFFVGQTAALVHDNTLPDLRLTAFDAVRAEPAAGAGKPGRSVIFSPRGPASMILTLILTCAMAAFLDPPLAQPRSTKPDMAAYEVARSRAGHDADSQVKLALWCERTG